MKIEYHYKKTLKRKANLEPIIRRKYEKLVKEVLTKGGNMKTGRWCERKSNVKVKDHLNIYS